MKRRTLRQFIRDPREVRFAGIVILYTGWLRDMTRGVFLSLDMPDIGCFTVQTASFQIEILWRRAVQS